MEKQLLKLQQLLDDTSIKLAEIRDNGGVHTNGDPIMYAESHIMLEMVAAMTYYQDLVSEITNHLKDPRNINIV